MRESIAFIAAAAVLVQVGAAHAQEEKPLDQQLPVPEWKVRIELDAWYVAPGGKLTLPTSGGGQTVNLSVMDMDNPRVSPLAEVDLRVGKWRISFTGFSFQGNTDASAATESGQIGNTAFSAGDQLKTSLEFQSLEATGGYRVWDVAMNPKNGVYAMVLGVDAIAGARLYDTSVSIAQASGPAVPSQDEFFGEPIVGIKADFDFYKAFSIDLRTTFGYMPGDQSSWSWDIAVTGVYRPIENVGILVGYRQLLFDLTSGQGNSEYEFNGGMAGLYTGIELRF